MSANYFRRSLMAAAILGFLVAPFATPLAQPTDITVFAAASLKNALDDAAKLYEQKTGDKVAISYAASSALAKQIRYFLFSRPRLDGLPGQGQLIETASRRILLGNTLVLIAPKDSTVSLTIAKDFPLLAALGADGKLAMANVDSVPAGKYGKAALSSLAVWVAVSPRVGQAENVRAALTFVAKGETPLSIVYGTDAKSEPAVKVIGTFPEASHPKINILTKLEARKFLDFLVSPEARPAFEAQGFAVLGGQS